MLQEPVSWPFPYPPADPATFLEVAGMLAKAAQCSLDSFIPRNEVAWLQTCSSGTGRTMDLQVDAAYSILDKLTKGGWPEWLRTNPSGCQKIASILLQMRKRIGLKEEQADQVAASLIARRLILFVTCGVEDLTPHGIESHGKILE